MTPNDSNLWDSLLQGKKDALAKIYSIHYKRLLAYGIKLHWDKELIKDCIQDLFVKIYLNRKNLKPTTNINAYLIKALKNKITDELSAHRKTESLDVFQFDLFKDDSLTELFTISDENLIEKEKLKQSLRLLSHHQQEVLYLRFVQEFDYNDIAGFYNMNYQSAKNLTSRTLAKLRTIYFQF